MKLTANIYNSPNPLQGKFENVIIEDTCVVHKRLEKYLCITFEMYYIKDSQRVTLAKTDVSFLGLEGEENSSNRTTIVSIPNPDYESGSDEPERIDISLFDYVESHNGEFPEDYIIIDYGYPTYEKVMEYFQGGTLTDPEITISDPLAVGFLMNCLIMNGEPVVNQFELTQNK